MTEKKQQMAKEQAEAQMRMATEILEAQKDIKTMYKNYTQK